MGNIALFFFCLITAGYVLWETGAYPRVGDASMDAGLYPRFLIYVLLLLAAALAVKIFREQRRAGLFSIKNPSSKAALLLIGCMAAYCLLLALVGYVAATMVFVFTVALMFRGSPKEGLFVSVGATTLLVALFRFAFQVPLPAGMFNLL